MVKKFGDLVKIVSANVSVGLALGVLEQEFHKNFPDVSYQMDSNGLLYSYWTLLWGGFVALNYWLTRNENRKKERACDIAANTLLGWTVQDAGYWMHKAGSLNLIGNVHLDWMKRYFSAIGDIASIDISGIPLAYIAAGVAYSAYLFRNVLKLGRRS